MPGAATRRSQASASSNPPATAAPLSAAITGTGVSVTTSNTLRPGRFIGGRKRSPRSSAARISLRSNPAQKAGPFPVRTTARTPSAAQERNCSTRSACSARGERVAALGPVEGEDAEVPAVLDDQSGLEPAAGRP